MMTLNKLLDELRYCYVNKQDFTIKSEELLEYIDLLSDAEADINELNWRLFGR